MGWYGMVSAEAMAYGRPSLAYMRPDFEPLTRDRPLVRTSVETLADDASPRCSPTRRAAAIGEASRAYVEREHESHVIARRLVDLYRSIGASRERPRLAQAPLRRFARLRPRRVAGKVVNFLLVPVLTRVLVPEQFGVSENVTQYTASMLLLVLVLGMDGALARFFYEQPDRQTRVRMVSSSFLFRLLTGGSVALLLAAFATPLAGALLGGEVREVPAHRRSRCPRRCSCSSRTTCCA